MVKEFEIIGDIKSCAQYFVLLKKFKYLKFKLD